MKIGFVQDRDAINHRFQKQNVEEYQRIIATMCMCASAWAVMWCAHIVAWIRECIRFNWNHIDKTAKVEWTSNFRWLISCFSSSLLESDENVWNPKKCSPHTSHTHSSKLKQLNKLNEIFSIYLYHLIWILYTSLNCLVLWWACTLVSLCDGNHFGRLQFKRIPHFKCFALENSRKCNGFRWNVFAKCKIDEENRIHSFFGGVKEK